MTNGEKLISDFPYIEIKGQDEVFTTIQIDITGTGTPIIVYTEWWDAEYKEPTTKNDLGVDCISRAEVIEEINSVANDAWDEEQMRVDLIAEINALPSVTPQPRKGHWIVQPSNKEQGERDFIWWKCSECGQVIYSETEIDRKIFHAFCGRCGAKMESEGKE